MNPLNWYPHSEYVKNSHWKLKGEKMHQTLGELVLGFSWALILYATCCLNNTWKTFFKLRLPGIVTDKAWIKPGTGAEKYAGTGIFITKTDEYTLETC